jgi:hypothetical protein
MWAWLHKKIYVLLFSPIPFIHTCTWLSHVGGATSRNHTCSLIERLAIYEHVIGMSLIWSPVSTWWKACEHWHMTRNMNRLCRYHSIFDPLLGVRGIRNRLFSSGEDKRYSLGRSQSQTWQRCQCCTQVRAHTYSLVPSEQLGSSVDSPMNRAPYARVLWL